MIEGDEKNDRPALVDPTVTCSTIKADIGVAVVTKTISRHLAKANRNQRALFVPSLYRRNIGNYIYSGAEPEQCGKPQIGEWWFLVMNSGLFVYR